LTTIFPCGLFSNVFNPCSSLVYRPTPNKIIYFCISIFTFPWTVPPLRPASHRGSPGSISDQSRVICGGQRGIG
jgi:hypothetical protein